MTEQTIIVGGGWENALAWCRANDVQPYAKTTRILSTPASAMGLVISPEDRVVWHTDADPRLIETVKRAQRIGRARA